MSTITVRLNNEEQKVFEKYAKLHDLPLSTLLKKALEEKIDDDLDLEAIKNYEKNLQNEDVEFYNQQEVKKIAGLIK